MPVVVANRTVRSDVVIDIDAGVVLEPDPDMARGNSVGAATAGAQVADRQVTRIVGGTGDRIAGEQALGLVEIVEPEPELHRAISELVRRAVGDLQIIGAVQVRRGAAVGPGDGASCPQRGA